MIAWLTHWRLTFVCTLFSCWEPRSVLNVYKRRKDQKVVLLLLFAVPWHINDKESIFSRNNVLAVHTIHNKKWCHNEICLHFWAFPPTIVFVVGEMRKFGGPNIIYTGPSFRISGCNEEVSWLSTDMSWSKYPVIMIASFPGPRPASRG